MLTTRHRRGADLRRLCACLLTVTLVGGPLHAGIDQSASTEELYKMDLEQLLKIELKAAAGLTETDSRRLPVAMTEMDERDIARSGAIDINRLFEIYVPNGQFIDHHHLQPHLGMRGIISDREDKYLFQVNGRTMNNRMSYGADNERGLPLLGDIRRLSVVRGPASATHGAGALAGVVALETHNGLTFQGFDVQLRQGIRDWFSAGEVRFGRKLSDDSGLFLYYGIADQQGADSDAAPYYIGRSYPARNGLPPNVAGEPSQAPFDDYWTSAFGSPYHKAHASYVKGPFELWFRYTRDGHQDRPLREIYGANKPATLAVDDWVRGRQFRNEQATVVAGFNKQVAPKWKLNLTGSFDRYALRDQRMGTQLNAPEPRDANEKELFGRAIATWTPASAHALAIGMEYSRERYDDPFFSDALDRAPVITQREWTTNTVSVLAEYQWKASADWTVFLSARTDKHTYSDWLVAPRGSVVFTPNEKDTIKLMVGESLRRGVDEELWAENYRRGTIPDPESLRSYELSYDRKLNDRWQATVAGFYEDYDALGWVPALEVSTSLGNYTMAGGEFQLTYRAPRTRASLSTGFTKLRDSSLPGNLPAAGQAITSQPYGFGNDLAEWAPFVTKLSVSHEIASKMSLNGSLIHYSGFPGGEDYAEYARTLATQPSAVPVSDVGYDTPYGPNLYAHLGVDYRATERLTVRVNGHNLVAPFDETLSKRNYYFRLSEFTVQPASVSLSLRYRF